MKQQVYQGHSERQFAEGDQMFVRLQPYKHQGDQMLVEEGCIWL
jgi:hypothetical protein